MSRETPFGYLKIAPKEKFPASPVMSVAMDKSEGSPPRLSGDFMASEPDLEPPTREERMITPTQGNDTDQLRKLDTGQLLHIRRGGTTNGFALPSQPGSIGAESVEDRRLAIDSSVFGGIASALGVVGLLASLLVGWALPVSVMAVALGILSVRREFPRRASATVGLATGFIGIIFSGFWIYYYVILLNSHGS